MDEFSRGLKGLKVTFPWGLKVTFLNGPAQSPTSPARLEGSRGDRVQWVG